MDVWGVGLRAAVDEIAACLGSGHRTRGSLRPGETSTTKGTTATAERGASGLEYAGILLIAAIVVGVVTAVVLASGVAPKAQAAFCSIVQMECGGDEDEVAIDMLLPPCEVNSTSITAGAEATVFSVNVGAEGTGILAEVRNTDGSTTWDLTISGGGSLGAHVMAGVEAEAAGAGGVGKSAEIRAAVAAHGGVTYTFATEQEARDAIAGFAGEAAKGVGSVIVSGPTAPITKWTLDQIFGTYTPPAASSYWIEGGLQASGSASASLGLELEVAMAASNGIGLLVTPGRGGESNSYTVYHRGTAELGVQFGAGVEGGVESVVGVTYRDGVPVEASIQVAGDVSAGLFATGTVDLADLAGVGAETTAGTAMLTLDLTNRANHDALANALQSVGMPVLGEGIPGYESPPEAFAALTDRFASGGPRQGATVTTQTFDGGTFSADAGVWGGKGLTFGGGAAAGVDTLSSTGAWVYDPDVGGMVQWMRCQ